MPPEQAEGAIDRLGPASDVYGLGAILYDLLTGKRPVEGTSLEEILASVEAGRDPGRRARSAPRSPPPWKPSASRPWRSEPEDRYPTPRALAADIKAWLADEPVSARPEPFAERARRWAKRNRTAVTAAAAALLVGLIGLGAVAAVQTKARNDLDRKQRARTAGQGSRGPGDRRREEVRRCHRQRARIEEDPGARRPAQASPERAAGLLPRPSATASRPTATPAPNPWIAWRLPASSLGYLTNEIGESKTL